MTILFKVVIKIVKGIMKVYSRELSFYMFNISRSMDKEINPSTNFLKDK